MGDEETYIRRDQLFLSGTDPTAVIGTVILGISESRQSSGKCVHRKDRCGHEADFRV